MLKFVILAVCLAAANANPIDNFSGRWTAIGIIAKRTVDETGCLRMTITTTNNQCTCSDGANAAYIVVSDAKIDGKPFFPDGFDEFKDEAVVFAKDTTEAREIAARPGATCECGVKKSLNYTVGKFFQNNYWVNNIETGNIIIYAKEVPTRAAFEKFVRDNLQDQPGSLSILCAKD